MQWFNAQGQILIDSLTRPNRLWMVNDLGQQVANVSDGEVVGDSTMRKADCLAARALTQAFELWLNTPIADAAI
jgi:hypothetical protein